MYKELPNRLFLKEKKLYKFLKKALKVVMLDQHAITKLVPEVIRYLLCKYNLSISKVVL